MIPPNILLYLFYAVFPLSGVSVICLIAGLTKREYEPTETEDETAPFFRGDDNPGIRKKQIQTQKTEEPDFSTGKLELAMETQIEMQPKETEEEWGERFRKEHFEEKPQLAEKREDTNFSRRTLLSPTKPSPSPPAKKPKEKETTFQIINQVLKVPISEDQKITTVQGTSITLKKGEKIWVLARGVKVDGKGNIVTEESDFELPEISEEGEDYGA